MRLALLSWFIAIVLLLSSCRPADDNRSCQSSGERIKQFALSGAGRGATFAATRKFVDLFGPRPTGSQQLENSITYLTKLLKDGGFHVHEQPFTFDYWRIDHEHANVYTGAGSRKLSISTANMPKPAEDRHVFHQKAPVILHPSTCSETKGKFVLVLVDKASFYNDCPDTVGLLTTGFEASHFEGAGNKPSKSHHTLHQSVFSVTDSPVSRFVLMEEDYDELKRLLENGKAVEVEVKVEFSFHRNFKSRNVIADWKGSHFPEQFVVLGAHIDGMPISDGAADDASGVMLCVQVLNIMKQLNLRPKRTIRIALWSAEEGHGFGSVHFAQKLYSIFSHVSMTMESDIGLYSPVGLRGTRVTLGAQKCLRNILSALSPTFGKTLRFELQNGSLPTDVMVFTNSGIPDLWFFHDQMDEYLTVHHSSMDTVKKLSSARMDEATAFSAAVAFCVADLPKLLNEMT